MAEVKWIKIVTDVFDDEKIRFIETLPQGDSIIVIWFKLLCMCGKSNKGGFLMMTDKIAYTDEMLSSIFNKDIKFIQLCINTFKSLDMIEIINNKYFISNWEKHQSIEKLEQIRESTRKRVARYREKQQQIELGCNVTVTQDVTQCNAIDKDKDKDKDIDNIYIGDENSNELPKKYLSIKKQIEDFTQDKELQEALNQFVLMREKIKKKLTNYAFFRLLNKLGKLSTDTNKQIEILNRSIEKSWSDIYPLENSNKNFKSNKKVVPIPDWYEDYKENLEKITNKPQDLSQEEIEKILTEAKEKL
jgi:predicted phage replisome organizer